MTTVLVVDDEPQIIRTLRITLSAHGYEVLTADDGRGALTATAEGEPDIVMLDLGLPDIDGTRVITGLRRQTAVPIIVLSGRTGSDSKTEALDAGADDYVTKPYGVDELLARLRAVLRRASTRNVHTPIVTMAAFTIDLTARKVHRDGTEVPLTPTEWKLLAILVRERGVLVSQQRLLHEVWGPTCASKTHYLRMYLGQLRHKLETDPSRPRHLITKPGMGYRFEP